MKKNPITLPAATADEVTPEQIEAWKKEHGEVYRIVVKDSDNGNKVAYLKKPTRKTLAYATSVAAKDPIKFNEIMLNGCWLAGDNEIKTDDNLFLSVAGHVSNLIQVKEAEMVKL